MAEGLNRWTLYVQESPIDLLGMLVGAKHDPCGQRWVMEVPQDVAVESSGSVENWVTARLEPLSRIHTPECDRELVKSWTKK